MHGSRLVALTIVALLAAAAPASAATDGCPGSVKIRQAGEGIFTVPEGKSITYTVRGVKSTYTGPGRWSTYCSFYTRPGTRRHAFLTSHLWGGEISVSGASTTFNDALVTTPEGR